MTAGFPLSLYGFCVVGIVLSLILPLVRDKLPTPRALVRTEGPPWQNYVYVAVFSLITAVLLMAFAHDAMGKWLWYDALIAGYAWDSTLQKMA